MPETPPTPLSPEDIENIKIEIQKELEADLQAQSLVSIALNELNHKLVNLRQEMATLNQKRQEYRAAMDRSRYTISIKRLRVKRMTDEFWRQKHGIGLPKTTM